MIFLDESPEISILNSGDDDMNYRKDIYKKVKFMLKEKDDLKLNYAKLERQYSCDPWTIKKHVERVKNNEPSPKRTITKKQMVSKQSSKKR